VEEACSRMILVPAVNMPCMTLQHAAGAPLSLLCTEKKIKGKKVISEDESKRNLQVGKGR
jgi:hypothetical protein